MRIAKYGLALVVMCTIPTGPACAQDADAAARLATAKALVSTTHAADAMIAALRANLPAQKQAMPQVPPEFWTRFEAEMVKEAPAFTDSIATVYAKVYSEPELQQLIAFFKSPVGRRMIELQPVIIAESSAVGQRWGERVAKELMQ